MGGRGAVSTSSSAFAQKASVQKTNEMFLQRQAMLDEAKKEYEEAAAKVEAIKARIDEEVRQYEPIAEAINRNYVETMVSKGSMAASEASAIAKKYTKEAIKDKRTLLQELYGYSKAMSLRTQKAKRVTHLQTLFEKLGE